MSLHVDFRGEALTMGIIIAAISGALSYALTAVVRSFALRNDVLDKPNERSSHDAPTPPGAGLAVIASTIVGMAIGVALRLVSARGAFTQGLGDGDYRDDRMETLA